MPPCRGGGTWMGEGLFLEVEGPTDTLQRRVATAERIGGAAAEGRGSIALTLSAAGLRQSPHQVPVAARDKADEAVFCPQLLSL